jgi:hypothetical protein
MLMVDAMWPESNGGHKPLPAPNVIVANPLDQPSPEAVRGMLINPIYTGIVSFPRLVEVAVWVRACAKLIEEDGAEQFLVNLLYVLREGCQRTRNEPCQLAEAMAALEKGFSKWFGEQEFELK